MIGAAQMRARQRGVALVLVLWMLVLLMVIAGSIATVQRNEVAMASAMLREREARAAIDAAHHYMLYLIRNRPPVPEEELEWKADGLLRHWTYQDQTLSIAASPENGRIDINMAPPEVLDKLFEEVGLDEETANPLRDAILDWKDPDDVKQLHGAEDPDYKASGLPYGARDARFETLDELLQVAGMTQQIYRKIQPALTVHSGQRTINPIYAPALVIYALPGMDRATADQYIADRDQQLAQGLPPAMPVGITGNYVSPGNLQIYRLYASVQLDNGSSIAGEVLATIGRGTNPNPSEDKGYVLLDRNYTPAPRSLPAGTDAKAE